MLLDFTDAPVSARRTLLQYQPADHIPIFLQNLMPSVLFRVEYTSTGRRSSFQTVVRLVHKLFACFSPVFRVFFTVATETANRPHTERLVEGPGVDAGRLFKKHAGRHSRVSK